MLMKTGHLRSLIFILWLCCPEFLGAGTVDVGEVHTSANVIPQEQTPISGPALVFDHLDLSYDFGSLSVNSSKELVITFANNGSLPLVIEKVQSSCGCTSALLSSGTVAPGEVGEIKAIFQAGSRPGAVNKTLTIFSNDPAHSAIVLNLMARIETDFSADPDSINFGRVMKKDLPLSRTVVITGRRLAELEIAKIESDSPFVKAALSSVQNGGSPQILVTLLGDPPLEVFHSVITIQTSSPDLTAEIKVYAAISGTIKLKPEMVVFQQTETNIRPEQKISVTNSRPGKFKIFNPEFLLDELVPKSSSVSGPHSESIAPGDLTIEFEAADEPGEVFILLKLDRLLSPGERLRGKIKFSTDDKDQNSILVRYYCYSTASSIKE